MNTPIDTIMIFTEGDSCDNHSIDSMRTLLKQQFRSHTRKLIPFVNNRHQTNCIITSNYIEKSGDTSLGEIIVHSKEGYSNGVIYVEFTSNINSFTHGE
jgi:hypothetical protein